MRKNSNDEYNNLRNSTIFIENSPSTTVENCLKDETKKSFKEKKTVNNGKKLSRNVRWIIFFILVNITIMVNMDHGTIPAATAEIKIDLKQGDDVLGFFGSLVFLGNIIGSLLSFSIINLINRKYLLIICLIFNGALLFVFTLTNIYWILFIDRILVGICQSFISIYMPVWCDQFGMKKKKTIMISIIQAGSPLGVVFGYLLTAYIKTNFHWTDSFIIQAIYSGFLALIILIIPTIYFSSKLNAEKGQDDQIGTNSSNNPKLSQNFSVYREMTQSENQDVGFFNNFCQIIKQKVFFFSTLALSNLFFIITAIQYWASDYEKQVLKEQDENKIFLSFIIVCITSPTLGLFFGGAIYSKFGGYESKHSIFICFIFGLLAGAAAIPVPYMNNVLNFTILLWLVLFFGGAILPGLIGIIITSLPHHLRGSANSMTNIITNLFGYLPAPAAYGLIYDNMKYNDERLAITIIMYSSFLGSMLLLIAMYYRYKNFKVNELLNERKTSLMSANSNYTNNLAKMFNMNTTIVLNPYENNEEKDYEESQDSSKQSPNPEYKEKKGNKSSSENLTLNIKKKEISIDRDKKSSKEKNLKTSGNNKNNKGKKSPSKSSMITFIEESTDIFNSSTITGKGYAINNVSIDSRYKKDSNYTNSTRYIDVSSGNKANPNFNYGKYLEENVFKENPNYQENINENKEESKKNKSDTIDFARDANSNIRVGKNVQAFPLSIKTPNFNFVGGHNENFSLEEDKAKIKNPSSYYTNNLEELEKDKIIFTEKEKQPKKYSEDELIKFKKFHSNVLGELIDGKDFNSKFSYESGDNPRSETSLFNPISKNFINNEEEDKKKEKDDKNEIQINKENLEKNKETDREIKEDRKDLDNEDFIMNHYNIDGELNKYNEYVASPSKKFNDYV